MASIGRHCLLRRMACQLTVRSMRKASSQTPALFWGSPRVTFPSSQLGGPYSIRPFSSKKDTPQVEPEDDGLPKDYKVRTLKAPSRRIDTFVGRATGSNYSQSEKLVLSGKVLVNDEKVTKKSHNVSKGDVIDVWSEECEDNAELAWVVRTELIDYELTPSGYDLQVKQWKKFLIQNWR